MDSLLIVSASFVFGALPFSFWVAKAFAGVDLRTVGSGNPGATNVLRVAGAGPAALALMLDIAKGAVPVLVAIELGEGEMVGALAAVAAIMGHILSPFLSLRGGKGVATGAGALAVLSPWSTAGGIVVFLLVISWKRYVSLASIVAAMAIAVLAAAGVDAGSGGHSGTLATVLVAVVVVARHLSNAKRIVEGQEPRLGKRVET